MAVTFLIIAVLLAGASYASFSAAANVAHTAAPNWALHVCTQSPLMCRYPWQMALAAAAAAAVALSMIVLSYFRNRYLDTATPMIDRIINQRPRR